MPERLPERSILERVVRRYQPEALLLSARPLEGGISAQIVALEIDRQGAVETLVLRRHGAWDLARNPRIAATEYTLLQALARRGLPVPAPRCLDDSDTILPSPWLLQEHLPGEVHWQSDSPAADGLAIAHQLAAIHAVDAAELGLEMATALPGGEPPPPLASRLASCLNDLAHPPTTLDEALLEGEIRRALLAAGPPAAGNRPALLHDDLWPGNILWDGGAISGVLDWSEAAVGDPLADLANSRLEILWAYGEEAVEAFTAAYLGLTGVDASDLPWWDLIAALKPCGQLSTWIADPAQEARMAAQQRVFARRALEALAGAPPA